MKLSLILPYWDRQAAANEAFALLAKHYKHLDLEIIVIDDGNAVPFVAPDVGLDIRCIRLPTKYVAKSPATPWNIGVKAASGDIIVLSCIEILHTMPVLEQMLDDLLAMGEDGYVLASAWCPEENKWHCHSTVKIPRNPWGTGQSYCSMMHKKLYEKAGGFDEDYRDGAGYEDNDFINRLLTVGARFYIRDDLVVTHPKSGAQIYWPISGFERNKALFYNKWPENYERSVTFVCVNWGNYCGKGKEYVNRLFDGVIRNLPTGTTCRFVCFSDDHRGLDRGIDVRLLPKGLTGWWNKLYLFRRGLFADNERIIYLDLDTVITGSLVDVIKYSGDFATLRDFYHPERLGPGVMLWRAGFGHSIWETYEEAGRPTDLPLGDLSWINKHFSENDIKADILQDLYPDQFCSYKVHASKGIPRNARVVCFHGFPRPHEAGGWVSEVWTKQKSKYESFIVPNVRDVGDNIKYACSLDIPWLAINAANDKKAIVVGGGPSLAVSLNDIREKQADGFYVIATNGVHNYLIDNGIIPDAHLIIDARDANAVFVEKPYASVDYFIAAQCSKKVFDKLNGMRVTLVHLNTQDALYHIPLSEKPINLLSGGSTVGLIALSLAHVLGYRSFYVYGMDSSYQALERHHAYDQSLNSEDRVLEVEAAGQTFYAAPWMIQQAQEFQQLALLLIEDECSLYVAGSGLLPHIARAMTNIPELPSTTMKEAI